MSATLFTKISQKLSGCTCPSQQYILGRTLNTKRQCKTKISRRVLERCISTSSPLRTSWEKPEGYETDIKVWNSLTKRKDPLILRHDRIATWYMCGPTVYDSAHIGHASTYMRFDIIRRIMQNFFEVNVMMVLGLTDIDDKLIAKANETGIPFTQIAWRNELEFFEDMAALNILPPSMSTRVTEFLPQIIKFIEGLVDKGFAYPVASGSVYFDVSKYNEYGVLCPPSSVTKEQEAEGHEKRHPRDFAMWKAAKPGEPMWEAPWGDGRPGWHIECSVMASDIFGSKLDLHAGGEDLIFPHHVNELAQSHCYHDCSQWANYWLHTGHLYLKGSTDKMSKSLKNVITISEFMDRYTADQFRVFCLLTHYRNRIEYTDETMMKAVQINKQIHHCLHQCDSYVRGHLVCRPINEERLHKSMFQARSNIEDALKDDFNTTRVMENVMELIKQLNISLGPIQIPIGPRSPAVISYISTYLHNTLARLGLQTRSAESQLSDPISQRLSHVMDSAVKFRSKVRSFAISPPEEILPKDSNKSEKEVKQKAMAPLLQACDDMRDDLKAAKVQILDHGKDASWRVILEEDSD